MVHPTLSNPKVSIFSQLLHGRKIRQPDKHALSGFCLLFVVQVDVSIFLGETNAWFSAKLTQASKRFNMLFYVLPLVRLWFEVLHVFGRRLLDMPFCPFYAGEKEAVAAEGFSPVPIMFFLLFR